MIELFDSSRLTVKRDHTLAALGSTLLVVSGLMAAYTAYLQVQLNSTQNRTQNLQAELAALDSGGRGAGKTAPTSPRAALVADLQRQAEQMERVAMLTRTASGNSSSNPSGNPSGTSTADTAPTPAQWMDHLSALTQADTSLQKVDIERDGSARIEGLASSPQALNTLVQAWEKEDGLAHLQPRSIDIKHEKSTASFLRFQLRATPAPAKAQPPGHEPVRPAAPATAPGAEAAQP